MGNEIEAVDELRQYAVGPETFKLTCTREIQSLQLENRSQGGPGVDMGLSSNKRTRRDTNSIISSYSRIKCVSLNTLRVTSWTREPDPCKEAKMVLLRLGLWGAPYNWTVLLCYIITLQDD